MVTKLARQHHNLPRPRHHLPTCEGGRNKRREGVHSLLGVGGLSCREEAVLPSWSGYTICVCPEGSFAVRRWPLYPGLGTPFCACPYPQEYQPISGNARFCELSRKLAFGADSPGVRENRIATVQALSGVSAV